MTNNFVVNNAGKVIINSSTINNWVFNNNGDTTISNTIIQDISNNINNYGNLTLLNSSINRGITNRANSNLTIDDDTILEPFFKLENYGEIITNQSMLPYYNVYTGENTIENANLSTSKTNNGNLHLINVTTRYISNNGNLIIDNSYLNGQIYNNGNLTINDDCTFGPMFIINNYGNILSDTTRLIPYYSTYSGNNIIENAFIGGSSRTNNGNLTIKNSTLNTTITNNGVLIIDDDVTFEREFVISGNGQIIIDDMSRVLPYFNQYNGNYTIINSVINGTKNNYGNLTIINSTVNGPINNQKGGNLIFINSILNQSISNNANVTISDDTIFGSNFRYSGSGSLIMNDSSKIIPYLYYIYNNFIIDNFTINKTLYSYGNVTIKNSVFTADNYQNYKNTTIINTTIKSFYNANNCYFTVYNSTLNGTVNNKGILIIADDVIFGEGYSYTGNGQLIMNNTKALLTINNVTLTAGQTATFQVNVKTPRGENINGGKVTFKVNGKTVKDTNGKVIYAKVVDGIAQGEYEVPSNLGGKEVTITAVYSGTSTYNKQTTTKTINVSKAIPTLTTSDITTTIGSTINLTATITDGDKIINTGKIVFKINGKTVKDENGKVIYAKVINNQVVLEYTLPESYKAKEYNITATLISPDYDRLTDAKTLIIN